VEYLQDFFGGGAAYALGRLNNECWYLYTLNIPKSIAEPDQTLEIIMTKLDVDVMKIFTKEYSSSAEDATQKSGIDKIFPNAILDGFLFDPCGYSVNAILPEGHYFTIHITPEASCSYVSFETNAPVNSYGDLIRRVTGLFKPGQFIVTFFANEGSIGREFSSFSKKQLHVGEFDMEAYQMTKVKNYDVTFAQYTKKPI